MNLDQIFNFRTKAFNIQKPLWVKKQNFLEKMLKNPEETEAQIVWWQMRNQSSWGSNQLN